MEPIYIPRSLDEKERILFLHMYEIIVFVAGFGIGITFKVPMLGLMIGVVGFALCRYLKRKGLLDVLANFLYWYLPPWGMSVVQFKLQGTPPSSFRIMTG